MAKLDNANVNLQKNVQMNIIESNDIILEEPDIFVGNPSPNQNFIEIIEALETHNITLVKQYLTDIINPNYREPAYNNRGLLIYAVKNNFVEAISYLLSNGADPLAVDDTGSTALHTAVSIGLIEPLKCILLVTNNPDPQDRHKRTPLHYAAQLLVSPESTKYDQNEDRNLEVVRTLLSAGASVASRDSDDRVPLHLCAQSGNTQLVKLLCKGRGISYISAPDKERLTPLHCAVQGSRSIETVKLLLDLGAKIDAKGEHNQTPLHIVAGRRVNYVDEHFDVECLQLLLSHGASVITNNNDNQNALSLALNRTMWWNRQSPQDDSINLAVQFLVYKGSPVTDIFSLWRMIEVFPSLVPYVLNQSLRINSSSRDLKHLRLDFDVRPLLENTRLLEEHHKQLIQQKNLILPFDIEIIPRPLTLNTEMSVLNYISSTGRKSLLRHPLCQAFLHFKWLKIRNFVIANLFFYLSYVLIITTFLLTTADCQINSGNVSISSSIDNKILQRDNQTTADNLPHRVNMNVWSWWISWLFYSVHTFREIIYFCHNPIIYVQLENLFDAVLIVCFPPLLWTWYHCIYQWQISVAAITVFAAWCRLLLLSGQFPNGGVYIVMFSTVAKNVLKFLVIYLPLMIAFILAFHILLRHMQSFQYIGNSVMTFLVMLTGEIDYKDQFLNETEERLPILMFFFLILFILLIYIILSNLLVGLAVSDLYAIQQRSELLLLSRQVELMVTVESMVRSRLIPERLQRYLLKYLSVTKGNGDAKLSVFPNRVERNSDRLFFVLKGFFIPEDFLVERFETFIPGFIAPVKDLIIPKSIVNEAITIALNNRELKKRDKQYHMVGQQTSSKFSRHNVRTNLTKKETRFKSIMKPNVKKNCSIYEKWHSIKNNSLEDYLENDFPSNTQYESLHTKLDVLLNQTEHYERLLGQNNSKMDELTLMIKKLAEKH